MARRTAEFQTIHSEGGLLPPDLLRRVIDPKQQLEGTRSEDYGLPQGERLNEVITQSWSRLRKHWAEFRKAAANLPEGEPGTGLTNDKWSLPLLRELGFGLLPASPGPEINGRTYAINRFFGPVPIHFVGCRVDLDRRSAGVRGAAATNPHGLVQEFLNRSEAHLWAVVSNGLTFRILRDNQALSRQSYLEFDLEAMFAGELYSDFVLLWLMAHATRFAPRADNRPDSCWLEHWTRVANEQGTRALKALRLGVERALQMLGEGFTSHPKNSGVRDALRTGRLSLTDFHGQLLRIVYRLIFLFVAEDRKINGQSLLHAIDASEQTRLARERFSAFYSTARLRELAARIKGSRHGDLWKQFQLVACALSGDSQYAAVRQSLALPALGSFLWDPNSTSAINNAELTNHDFLEALRDLAFTRQGKVLRPVDYKDLGAEELGGVYESLLALTPQISADGARFTFAELAGNERKTSGSYYTPDSLVQCVLDSALDPVVDEATRGKAGKEAEKAILSLKVCDPAVGSGHFLVGAAHRLARHLSRVRAVAQGESEPSPLVYQHAVRDVIGHCLYGVDMNPMAVELCRVSLWLEALEPGKPLSFLEHRIRCGNSLLGATPALLAKGIPDEAFDFIEGDDKAVCKDFRSINKDERRQQGQLFSVRTDPWEHLGDLAANMMSLDLIDDETIEGVREKQKLYERAIRSGDYSSNRFWADTWCAAFVWKKTREFKYPITEEVFRPIEHNPHAVDAWMREEIQRLATTYQFFHWHLEFPDVFHVPKVGDAPNNQAGWSGGFDCVIGNPPWRMTEDDSRIEEGDDVTLGSEDEAAAYQTKLKRERATYVRSGRFPLAAQNRLQLARLFAELFGSIRAAKGMAGMIVPSTITVNAFDRPLWSSWVESGSLACVWDFVNLESLFPEVDSRQKFSVICLKATGGKSFRARCWMTDPSQISSDPEQAVQLSKDDLCRYSGAELSLPHFRGQMDLSLLASAVKNFGRIRDAEDWCAEYVLLGATNDRDFVKERRRAGTSNGELDVASNDWIPVYEGKMVGVFDHRLARVVWKSTNVKRRAQEETLSDSQKSNPDVFATPLWEVPRAFMEERDRLFSNRRWDIALCDVTSALNERTALPAVVPLCFATHNLPLVRVCAGEASNSLLLLAALGSHALDYFARLRVATNHLTEGIFNTLPIPSPKHIRDLSAKLFADEFWLAKCALELSYTAWDLNALASDFRLPGPPFRWDANRRFNLRCELDAAFFHLLLPAQSNGEWVHNDSQSPEQAAALKAHFAAPRDAVCYVMDTFSVLRRNNEATFSGDYRTKRTILEMYDAMGAAIQESRPYLSPLSPTPGSSTLRHPKKRVGVLAFGSLIQYSGEELQSKIFIRIKTETPFPVEYGRISRTRGGAPTLVPHPAGAPVSAEILVLDNSVPVEEARDMLWRREVHKVGTNEHYTEGSGPNNVLVKSFTDHPCVSTVLYTNFNESGKLEHPEAHDLARRAIESVRTAKEGEDGISYLMNAIAAGINTPLTEDYRSQILEQTNSMSLEEALRKAKEQAAVATQGGGRD